MSTADSAANILSELENVAEAHGIDIVDVEVVGATKAPCVRVRIDWADEQKGAISLDDVASETKWISEALDALDPFTTSYTLEVSSPGLDRPLRRERDFERFAGQTVVITTTALEGRKKFTGTLEGIHDGHVVLAIEGEGTHTFALGEIKRAVIKPDYSALASKSK